MNSFNKIISFTLACFLYMLLSCKDKEKITEPPVKPFNYKGKIVYQTSNNQRISLIDFDSENQKPKLLFEPGTEPVVSPDREKIIFTVDSRISLNGTLDLFIMNIDGSNAMNLTSTDYLGESFPEWCPDNNKVIFDSRNEAVYTINVDGTNLHLITDTSNNYLSFLPSWAPDGNHIAYIDVLRPIPSEPQNKRLKVISITDSSDIILDNLLIASHIKWSPDSKKIIYEKKDEGICIWDFITNSNHKINVNEILFNYATWLPNGDILCCGKKLSENLYGIYILPINDLNNPLQILSGFYSSVVIPSSDGSHIAIFTRRLNENGLYLYISKSDGSDLQKVWMIDESNETIINDNFYCDWIE
jgi:Tol biopolymer transport system component